MQKPDAPRYYGLLYVDRNHSQHVNLRTRKDPVAVYVGCAALLAASARSAGESFAVFTNAADELLRIAKTNGFPRFDCVEIPFHLDIPENTRFYQAHYKLCALEAMAWDPRCGFSGLIDIDAVLQAPLSARLGPKGLYAYVIDEGLAGASVGDLDLLIGPSPTPRRWFGGEFIAGDSASLRQLTAAVKMLLPRYLEVMPRLVHVGDETIVSAALNMLDELGAAAIHDVGPERLVARWYSSRLLVQQQRLTEALDAAVLHLPSDKTFLQEHARRWLGPDRFRQDLTRHMMAKSMVRAMINPVLSLAEGERKYAPRL